MADLYLTPAEKYTAALGGFYYGDLPEPGTVYTQLIKDILNGTTPEKEPKNILARFIYSLYISDLSDPYPRYELAKLLYWKLHDITPTKSGSILTVTIDGKEDYMTINTDLSRLWYKVLFGSKTDVITDFPYIFNTMQNKLSDWELFGNTVQNGTHTPDNPIMPEGTGERTGNLAKYWKPAYVSSDGLVKPNSVNGISFPVKLEAEQTVTFTNQKTNFGRGIAIFSEFDGENFTNMLYRSTNNAVTYTADSDCYVIIWGNYDNTTSMDESVFVLCGQMLNFGSEALPYEPFGVKIPISSANTTTPVYLGEVETTRKIKKLVLTGEEEWQFFSDSIGSWQFYINNISLGGVAQSSCVSNIAPYGVTATTRPRYDYGCYLVTSGSGVAFQMKGAKDTFTGITAWKSYLAAQYAAGTPVTVWYVLTTETTGIVNEPLMKIGDYTDSMSRTQTGIDIPTVVGQNTLDVLTTVKPSSMRIEYTSSDENRSRSKRISLLKSPLKKGLIK